MATAQVLQFLRTCGHRGKRLRCSQPSPGTTGNCRMMVLASVGEPALLGQVCKDLSLKNSYSKLKTNSHKARKH